MRRSIVLLLAVLCFSCSKKVSNEPIVQENAPRVVPKPSEIEAERKKRIAENERLRALQPVLETQEGILEEEEIQPEATVVEESEIEKEDENKVPKVTEEDFSLIYGDEIVHMYTNVDEYSFFEPVYDEVLTYDVKVSNFDGFTMAWRTNENDRTYVYFMGTESPKYKTPRNIGVGSTKQEIIDAYGDGLFIKEGKIKYELPTAIYECILILFFYMEDDKVVRIHIQGYDC